MRTKRRWMMWVLEEADTLQFAMPWERGTRTRAWRKRLSASVKLLSNTG